MLVRSDPFRQFDRLAEQVFGTVARPAAMPMDAWREGHDFVVEFDLPGIDPASIDLDVERNVLTVRAERKPSTASNVELVASERPRGVFSRQVILGDALDSDKVTASYNAACCASRSRWRSGPSPARSSSRPTSSTPLGRRRAVTSSRPRPRTASPSTCNPGHGRDLHRPSIGRRVLGCGVGRPRPARRGLRRGDGFVARSAADIASRHARRQL
jgi:HSP20 family protein